MHTTSSPYRTTLRIRLDIATLFALERAQSGPREFSLPRYILLLALEGLGHRQSQRHEQVLAMQALAGEEPPAFWPVSGPETELPLALPAPAAAVA